jgi:hypothetical protein
LIEKEIAGDFLSFHHQIRPAGRSYLMVLKGAAYELNLAMSFLSAQP